MKLKKYIGVFAALCITVLFAGCYEPLDITDSEMDMVAEYAAGVLVKHGTKATDTLLDRQEQEIAFAEMATPTPRPTLAPSKEDKNPSGGNSQGGEAKATSTPVPTAVPDNTELTMQDLTKLMSKKNFFFRYKGYKTTMLYQGAGDLFAAAGEGKQLVVLEFEVTNQSDVDSALVLNKGTEKEFVYGLRVGNKTIKPSLTLLEEDFYTSYDVMYKAGETKTCVLVFECKEDTVTENMTLSVLRDVEGKEDSVLVKIK